MKMVSMARTKADKKAEKDKYDKPYSGMGGEDFPYGLSVSLNHESLKKLGLHDGAMPQVGQKLMLHAHAHVKEAREEQREGGEKHRRLELELRHMAIEKQAATPKSAVASEESLNKGAKAEMDKVLSKGYDSAPAKDSAVKSSTR